MCSEVRSVDGSVAFLISWVAWGSCSGSGSVGNAWLSAQRERGWKKGGGTGRHFADRKPGREIRRELSETLPDTIFPPRRTGSGREKKTVPDTICRRAERRRAGWRRHVLRGFPGRSEYRASVKSGPWGKCGLTTTPDGRRSKRLPVGFAAVLDAIDSDQVSGGIEGVQDPVNSDTNPVMGP